MILLPNYFCQSLQAKFTYGC